MSRETQRQKIKEHLQSGKPLSAMEALNEYGCFRLAAEIFILKERGMDIESRWDCHINSNGVKKRFKVYYVKKKL